MTPAVRKARALDAMIKFGENMQFLGYTHLVAVMLDFQGEPLVYSYGITKDEAAKMLSQATAEMDKDINEKPPGS